MGFESSGGHMKKDINQLFVYPKSWVSTETKEIAASVRQWANKEVIAKRIDYQEDYKKLFSEARKKLAFDIGCQGLMLPEDSGGFGFNRLTDAPLLISILKEISRADAGIGFVHALEYTVFSIFAIEPVMNPELCGKLAPLFCSKTLKTVSLILPGFGKKGIDDPLFEGRSVRARIQTADEKCMLSGRDLRPIGCGADAALFCVICSDANEQPCVALVPGDSAGITRHETIRKTGLDGCDNADIDFENVQLPKENVITRNRAAYELYAWLNLLLAGVSVGACMGILEIVSAWSGKRIIKGKNLLKDNPLCAAVLADVYEEIAIAWLLTHNLANSFANPGEWGNSSSPLIFSVSQMLGRRVQESAIRAINRTMELMASEGYATEGGVEKMWRDVKTIQSCLCGPGGEVPTKLDVAKCIFDSQTI